MWAMIGTWCMALEGIKKASEDLKQRASSLDAVEVAIKEVEDNPYFKSVGFGGLPNEHMEVELDAAFMNGDTLDIGAVGGIKDFANPISIARRLSQEKINNFLVGLGAEEFALKENFERKVMLSERAKIHYYNRQFEVETEKLVPYAGHDTVGILGIDSQGTITAGTSTSGLFMKKRGRLGDSPIIGSGLYADSEVGAASATGLGEDLMKGVISYEIVRLMKDGLEPQQACEKAISDLSIKLKNKRGEVGDLSVVALDSKGNWGAATTIENFSIVVTTTKLAPTVMLVKPLIEGRCMIEEASQEWLDNYLATRTAPLLRKGMNSYECN